MDPRRPSPKANEMMLSLDVTFALAFAIGREGDYVATCPELPGFALPVGISTQPAPGSHEHHPVTGGARRCRKLGAAAALHGRRTEMAPTPSDLEHSGFTAQLRAGEAFRRKTIRPTSQGVSRLIEACGAICAIWGQAADFL